MTDKIKAELPTQEELAWAKIVGETAKIEWKQLQTFFASGHVLTVAAELDLVEVAYDFSNDNAENLKPLIEKELIAAASDQQALEWYEKDAIMWSCVVRPWVLVQEVT
ncbi:MAG: DUF2288 family protein [Gammaproteobacteria bacterium]|nr:DUF2288 family protein [Gammaproteobacteria bacterium]